MKRIRMHRISKAIANASLPAADRVVGIATGGVVPASLLAYRLDVEMHVLKINYRDEQNNPRYEEPQLVGPRISISHSANHLLLVDDVSVTGKTLDFARRILPKIPVTTLVLKGEADLVLLPETKECVHWPWEAQNKQNQDVNKKIKEQVNVQKGN